MSKKRKIVEFEPGQVVLKEGKLAHGMYVLVSGALEVSFQGRVVSEITNRGEYVGEIGALLGGRRQATVIARKHTKLMFIENVTQLFETSPSSALMVAKSLASRVVEMNRKIVTLLANQQSSPNSLHSY
ncbi:MAG: Crp/Fnr family transcriptional regulator [Chitinispirillaceae bacterium]